MVIGLPPAIAGRLEIAKAALAQARVAIVHTDGGCEPNPGVGGWGVTVDVAGMEAICLWGGAEDSTNNRMEITAAIVALSVLPAECAVTIICDSQLVTRGMTEWIPNWRENSFHRGRSLIPNADLWQVLDKLCDGRKIVWQWVRGHSGDKGNELADRLATRGRQLVIACADSLDLGCTVNEDAARAVDDAKAEPRSSNENWGLTDTNDLSAAIKEFERALPGWWFSVYNCATSRDASCAPDRLGQDADLLVHQTFDGGFHRDDPVGSMADALRHVMRQGLAAKAEWMARK